LVISETFGRVAFPAFSKLQDDKELLARTVERSIRMMTLVMFPITAIMVALGPEMTHVVFTDKWMPGIWAYYFYCTSPLIIGIMLPMYSAILSLGKSAVLLKMTGFLLFLEWGIGVPGVIVYGFNGIAFSQPIIAAIFYVVYMRVLTSESITIKVLVNIKWQLVTAIMTAVIIRIIANNINFNLSILLSAVSAGLLMFAGMMFTVNRQLVMEFKEYLLKIKG
jgi:O-antigen/teichoic acid export membrane protein